MVFALVLTSPACYLSNRVLFCGGFIMKCTIWVLEKCVTSVLPAFLNFLLPCSRIWNETWLAGFFYKPCNYELFVKQSLNMEMAIVMARVWILTICILHVLFIL